MDEDEDGEAPGAADAGIVPRALNDYDAARYIGMSVDYLRAARRDGPFPDRTPPPPHIKINRSVRYLRDDLDRWLEKCRVL